MLRELRRRWGSYKYRFVPWLAFNLRRQRRTLRYVPESSQDKIIADEDVFETLLKTFKALFINDFNRQADVMALLPEVKCQYLELLTVEQKWSKVNSCNHQGQQVFSPEEVLFNTLGFTVSRDRSSLVSAGTGVFVTRGFVPKGTVVSMYPGNGLLLFLIKLGALMVSLLMGMIKDCQDQCTGLAAEEISMDLFK